MDMLRHHDEGVQLITAVTAIAVESLQEEAHVILEPRTVLGVAVSRK